MIDLKRALDQGNKLWAQIALRLRKQRVQNIYRIKMLQQSGKEITIK